MSNVIKKDGQAPIFTGQQNLNPDSTELQKNVKASGTSAKDPMLKPENMQEVLQGSAKESHNKTNPDPQTVKENNAESKFVGKARIGDVDVLNGALMRHECEKSENDGSVHEEDGKMIKDMEVSQEIADAIDLLSSAESDATLEGAQKALKALDDIIERQDPLNEPLVRFLDKLHELAELKVQSHTSVVGELQDQVNSLQKLKPQQQLEEFKEISTIRAQLDNMVQMSELSLDDDADPDQVALAQKRLHGRALTQGGADKCRDILLKSGVEVLRNCLPSNKQGVVTDELLQMALLLHFESGVDPMAILNALERATDDKILTPEVIKEFLGFVTDKNSSLQEKMGFIDSLFLATYPYSSGMALDLKLALVPQEDKDLVTAQHNYVISWNILTKQIFKKASGPVRYSLPNGPLTPAWVAQNCPPAELKRLEYYIAHVACLQNTVFAAGFYGEANKNITQTSSDPAAWGKLLMTGKYIENTIERMDSPENGKEYKAYLNDNVARFNNGFEGSRDLKMAEHALENASGPKALFDHRTTADKLLSQNSSYLAHKHLDTYITYLTGFHDPDKRLLVDENKAQNGAIVDEAIRKNMRSNAAAHSHDPNDPDVLEYYNVSKDKESDQKQLQILNHDHKLQQGLVDELAVEKNEYIRLLKARKEVDPDYEKHKAVWQGLSYPWIHTYKSRLPICMTVKEICVLVARKKECTATMAKLDPNADAGRIAELQNEIEFIDENVEKKKKTLQGVDDKTMAYTAFTATEYSTETIVNVLGPKADAVIYYSGGRAKEVRKERAKIMTKLIDSQKKMDKLEKKFEEAYGKDNIKEIKIAYRAAILKVFAESGLTADKFCMYDKANSDKIFAQLHAWDINTENLYFRHMLDEQVNELASADGNGLNTEFLKAEKDPGGSRAMIRTMQNMPKTKDAPSLSKMKERGETILQQKGVKFLMDAASVPGGGFNYSRSQGLSLSTSVPLADDNDQSKILLTPFKAQFGYMHKNSINVRNTGDGYAVAVTSDDLLNLSAAVGVYDLYTGSSIGLNGKIQGGKTGGIYLHFSDKQSCEDFLQSYINPETKPASSDDKPSVPTWLKNSEVRFFDEYEVSGSIGGMANVGSFSAKLGTSDSNVSGAVSVLSVEASVGGSWTHDVKYNAHGTSTTITKKVTVSGSYSFLSASGSASAKLYVPGTGLNQTVKAGKSVSVSSNSLKVELTTAAKLDEDRNGMLLPTTSMTTSVIKGGEASLENTLLHLKMPVRSIQKIENKESSFGELDSRWTTSPDSTVIKLEWELRPEKHREALNLQVQIKANPNGPDVKQLTAQYENILADMQSYTPKKLSFVNDKNTSLSSMSIAPAGMINIKLNKTYGSTKTKSYDIENLV